MFQVLPHYQYLKLEDGVVELQFYRNELKWNRLLIRGENLEKLDNCFISESKQPNKR